jgi:hypothetical protein
MFLQSFSHVGFRSIWENLISASDGCSHTPGKPKRFSLAAHVHATIAPWRMSAIGVKKRTSNIPGLMSAFDPTETCGVSHASSRLRLFRAIVSAQA